MKTKKNNIKDYAILNNVPIITDEGLAFICDYIKLNNVKKILEIGTAIGYSAINFSKANDASVDSIERDEVSYQKAIEFIEEENLSNMIRVTLADALTLDVTDFKKEYDLIFIDAAKAQYQKFFLKYSPFLKEGGVIICDNLDFHGLAAEPDKQKRSLRQLLTKINNFKDFLMNNEDFETTYHQVGDGISISKRKQK